MFWLATATVLSFTAVGGGIVLPAWIGYGIGGSQLVGVMLLSVSLSGLLIMPITGHLIDRSRHLNMVMLGQSIRALSFLLLAIAPWAPTVVAIAILLLAGWMKAFAFAVIGGGTTGIIQALTSPDRRAPVVFRLASLRQIATACGTALAGVLIAWSETLACLLFAVIALTANFPVSRIAFDKARARVSSSLGFVGATHEGLRYLASRTESLRASLAIAISYSAVQVTNALLPGYVHQLGGDSTLYGTLESVAAAAGAGAVLLFSVGFIARRFVPWYIQMTGLTGILLCAFGYAGNVALAIVIYAACGALWNVSRTAAVTEMMAVTDSRFIGRVQAATALTSSAFGAAIALLPMLASDLGENTLYVICGMTIMIAAVLLLAMPDSTTKSCDTSRAPT